MRKICSLSDAEYAAAIKWARELWRSFASPAAALKFDDLVADDDPAFLMQIENLIARASRERWAYDGLLLIAAAYLRQDRPMPAALRAFVAKILDKPDRPSKRGPERDWTEAVNLALMVNVVAQRLKLVKWGNRADGQSAVDVVRRALGCAGKNISEEKIKRACKEIGLGS